MLSLHLNLEKKVLFGSIQLPSFLGKSSSDLLPIAEFAANNAIKFKEGGFDGVFIQDTTPGSLTMDTLCNLASITRHVKDAVGDFPLGTQMECDSAEGILAVAKSTPCDMVRIKTYVGALLKNNGLFNGQGPNAYRYSIVNNIQTNILCDIFNLTGIPIGNLSLTQACSMALNLGVSGLIICGHGEKETVDMLQEVKTAFPKAFVICGGNANERNINSILSICDGAIVSSCLRDNTKTQWDSEKIRYFTRIARN